MALDDVPRPEHRRHSERGQPVHLGGQHRRQPALGGGRQRQPAFQNHARRDLQARPPTRGRATRPARAPTRRAAVDGELGPGGRAALVMQDGRATGRAGPADQVRDLLPPPGGEVAPGPAEMRRKRQPAGRAAPSHVRQGGCDPSSHYRDKGNGRCMHGPSCNSSIRSDAAIRPTTDQLTAQCHAAVAKLFFCREKIHSVFSV